MPLKISGGPSQELLGSDLVRSGYRSPLSNSVGALDCKASMKNPEEDQFKKVFESFVDLLLPELTPFEATVYVILLRRGLDQSDDCKIRIGQRTLAKAWASPRAAEVTSRAHILRTIKGLEEKGVIEVGDTNREGTLYAVLLPDQVPSVKEKLRIVADPVEEDFFTDPIRRKEIFKRDKYVCFYCGEKVTQENATLDHLIPQHIAKSHARDNLKTSCLTCNSIKSGKTYDEAAPLLLRSIQRRCEKTHNEK